MRGAPSRTSTPELFLAPRLLRLALGFLGLASRFLGLALQLTALRALAGWSTGLCLAFLGPGRGFLLRDLLGKGPFLGLLRYLLLCGRFLRRRLLRWRLFGRCFLRRRFLGGAFLAAALAATGFLGAGATTGAAAGLETGGDAAAGLGGGGTAASFGGGGAAGLGAGATAGLGGGGGACVAAAGLAGGVATIGLACACRANRTPAGSRELHDASAAWDVHRAVEDSSARGRDDLCRGIGVGHRSVRQPVGVRTAVLSGLNMPPR